VTAAMSVSPSSAATMPADGVRLRTPGSVAPLNALSLPSRVSATFEQLRSSWNVSCRLTHVVQISSYSPRQRQGSDAKTDFRRAAPAAANRQVEHALVEYKWKQITAFRSKHWMP
jgi:hypothetical protein